MLGGGQFVDVLLPDGYFVFQSHPGALKGVVSSVFSAMKVKSAGSGCHVSSSVGSSPSSLPRLIGIKFELPWLVLSPVPGFGPLFCAV